MLGASLACSPVLGHVRRFLLWWMDALLLVPVNGSTLYSSRYSFKPCAQDAGALGQPFATHITSFSRKAQKCPKLVFRSLQKCQLLGVTIWSKADHFRMGKERKHRLGHFPWSSWKRGTTKSCPHNGPGRTGFGCQQLPGAAADANATGSCRSCSARRPGEATADNTLQVFSPRTKGLFSGC